MSLHTLYLNCVMLMWARVQAVCIVCFRTLPSMLPVAKRSCTETAKSGPSALEVSKDILVSQAPNVPEGVLGYVDRYGTLHLGPPEKCPDCHGVGRDEVRVMFIAYWRLRERQHPMPGGCTRPPKFSQPAQGPLRVLSDRSPLTPENFGAQKADPPHSKWSPSWGPKQPNTPPPYWSISHLPKQCPDVPSKAKAPSKAVASKVLPSKGLAKATQARSSKATIMVKPPPPWRRWPKQPWRAVPTIAPTKASQSAITIVKSPPGTLPKITRLNTEIKNLENEIAENKTALDKATAIRHATSSEMPTKPPLMQPPPKGSLCPPWRQQ